LLNTLHTLSDHSLSTTRRLDDIYYSILEKVTTLRSTISSLQELSTLTRELHKDFVDESNELQEDIEGQIEAFGNFEQQKEKVDDLEQRIQKGRERAEKMSERLSKCRDRVALVERLDAEEAEKTSRFYRILWSTLGTFIALIFTIMIVHHVKSPARTVGGTAERVSRTVNLSEVSIPPPVREILERVKEEKSKSHAGSTPYDEPGRRLEESPERLKIFDEL
ncbi:hypothetical protein NA57DRAFT_37635, partial [Rhizodiscina lignyota]